MPHYRGAGILFIAATAPRGHQLLLARRKSGVWSILGGGSTRHDADAAATAWRETHEEFGHPQHPGQILFTQRYPFALLGFDWTTLVVELPAIPDPSIFPSPHARDFHREFTEARWFPIHQLPERTHLLIYPLLLRLHARRYQRPKADPPRPVSWQGNRAPCRQGADDATRNTGIIASEPERPEEAENSGIAGSKNNSRN